MNELYERTTMRSIPGMVLSKSSISKNYDRIFVGWTYFMIGFRLFDEEYV